uniref:Chromosome partition protein Smc n=1 Tax=Wolbachia endosymbiont of Aleurodicus floccissimus TaxID=2152762 RepID=A0A3B0IWP1_9RICK
MPNFGFSDLKDLVDVLYDSYYVPHPVKIKLAELFEDVLELEGKKSPEDAISTFKSKIKNELKSEMKSKMKQKINKLEQLEAENKDLQTKKNRAERLNRLLECAKETAKNENIELKAEKNKLNTQIQHSQQEKKILEVKNEANKQLKEKATYIATASTGLAVGLVVYITLEHTTKLDMWLIIVIATISAFLAGGLIMKPSSQVNGTQEPQGVANESSIT